MSRSRKKVPVDHIAYITRGAVRKWKSESNRRIRRIDGDIPPGAIYKRLGVDVYFSPHDGKQWVHNEYAEKAKRK